MGWRKAVTGEEVTGTFKCIGKIFFPFSFFKFLKLNGRYTVVLFSPLCNFCILFFWLCHHTGMEPCSSMTRDGTPVHGMKGLSLNH